MWYGRVVAFTFSLNERRNGQRGRMRVRIRRQHAPLARSSSRGRVVVTARGRTKNALTGSERKAKRYDSFYALSSRPSSYFEYRKSQQRERVSERAAKKLLSCLKIAGCCCGRRRPALLPCYSYVYACMPLFFFRSSADKFALLTPLQQLDRLLARRRSVI